MKKILLLLAFFLTIFRLSAQEGFIYLEVDGIEVTIEDIIFGIDYANSITTGSISLNQTVDLTGNPNDVFTGGITLYLERGYDDALQFDHININMGSGIAIKAHGYLGSNTHVYTSSLGVKTTVLASATWVAPSDYGYLPKNYIYRANEEKQNETTFMGEIVTYNPASGLDIRLLVDTYNVAYYWDGNDATRHGFVDSWHQEDSSLFPTGTKVISVSYIPFYVSVNKNLVSETYVVASGNNPAALDNLPDIVDEKLSMYLTLVFDANTGSFYTGRTANWDGLNDYTLNLPQFVQDGTLSGGTYTLELASFDESSGGWVNGQTITNFTRLSSPGLSGTQATVDPGAGSNYELHYYRVK